MSDQTIFIDHCKNKVTVSGEIKATACSLAGNCYSDYLAHQGRPNTRFLRFLLQHYGNDVDKMMIIKLKEGATATVTSTYQGVHGQATEFSVRAYKMDNSDGSAPLRVRESSAAADKPVCITVTIRRQDGELALFCFNPDDVDRVIITDIVSVELGQHTNPVIFRTYHRKDENTWKFRSIHNAETKVSGDPHLEDFKDTEKFSRAMELAFQGDRRVLCTPQALVATIDKSMLTHNSVLIERLIERLEKGEVLYSPTGQPRDIVGLASHIEQLQTLLNAG